MAGWAVSIFTMFLKAIWKEILIVTKKILLLSPIIHFGKIYPKETTQWKEKALRVKVFVATLCIAVRNWEQGNYTLRLLFLWILE